MQGSKTSVAAVLGSLVLASTSALAHAQIVGFKMGPTYSTLHMPDANIRTNGSLSFGGGSFIRFHIGPIGIQPELLAVTKGADVDRLFDPDFELQLKYLEVLFLLRVETEWGRFKSYAMAGPTVSFEYDCEFDIVVDDQESSFDCSQVGPADVFERNTTDIGVTGVLGFDYGLGPGTLLVEGRYTHGFTNIANQGNGGVLDTRVSNRYAALLVGYSFRIHIF